MEVFLYNSTVCRLCGEENDNGSFLYSSEENNQNLCELVNKYLPIKVSDDGQLPRTICPGCAIQLEATVEFINLIIDGQKTIRSLYEREKEYKKTILKSATDSNGDRIVSEVNETRAYSEDHPISLRVAGLEKPKRKRGRPPKKQKTPEELAQEEAAQEAEVKAPKNIWKDEPTGKRRRKTPERFKEVVQGKELEKIFIEEGVIDGEENDIDVKPEKIEVPKQPILKIPEVIGHTESGELVVVVKGKGRGRPKGRLRPTISECAICGAQFTCSGRYMSHVAAHGPVMHQCAVCEHTYDTRLLFNKHQEETGHTGQNIISCKLESDTPTEPKSETIEQDNTDLVSVEKLVENATNGSLPDLNPQPLEDANEQDISKREDIVDNTSVVNDTSTANEVTESPTKPESKPKSNLESPTKFKPKLKCPHCDKKYSSKQSKSLHIKAAHKGERAYICSECGAAFAYPRALALHRVAHQRRTARGYACDLCGKVLNHPSSVAYHKEAEHAGQRYVCNKCGKSFKHRQLLQRHQLVHTQNRPYTCKVCNSKFKTKANLLNHQLLHSGVKKFSCDICKQKFAHKTSLTLHVRWHNGQKPFVCKVCNKAFSQKGNLSEHLRIHTGEKPFQCALCPRRFTTSSQHRLHLRRHQNNENRQQAASRHLAACATLRKIRGSTAKRSQPASPAPASPASPASPAVLTALPSYSKIIQHTSMHKQISLLSHEEQIELEAEDSNQFTVVEETGDDGVIYVAYEVDDDNSPAYHILETNEQSEDAADSDMLSPCELYSSAAVLVDDHKLDLENVVQEHMPVTDEEGNPLHFTMQDGTRLAITSFDGHSLHVITQDGQTIPVEINELSQDEDSSI